MDSVKTERKTLLNDGAGLKAFYAIWAMNREQLFSGF